jgi:SAM-dependent methyltransferase
MVTTLCFLDDVEKSFSEIYRILKEHGRFIIGFVDKDSPIGKKYFESKNEITFYKYADFYSTDDVLRLLKKFNFKDVDILQTIFGNPEDIKDIQEFKRGHGEGVFVVVVSEKQGDIQ